MRLSARPGDILMTTRRDLLLGAASLGFLDIAAQAQGTLDGLRTLDGSQAEFARIERDCGGRLGVAVFDTATQSRAGHRAGERFPMCSTFKLLAAAAVLARVDAGKETLDRRVTYKQSDLITYSPTTEKHVADGMTMAALCEAAMTLSDNTAANLMLESIGGPAGLTAYLRSIGDGITRLDRTETALNEARPGDPRDATTPDAMLRSLDTLLFGKALSPSSQELLANWLIANKTGDGRLRAGLPRGWRCGDKTGSGARGTTNDVAAIWPPNRKPILVAAYLTETDADATKRDGTLAAVARVVAGAVTV
jgi:beta-lactamase class A